MNQAAKHIIFAGKVQGVGFRFTAFNAAQRHQLKGLVRNLINGNVEMIVHGRDSDITDCIHDIQQTFGTHISETRIEEIPFDPRCKDFKITF